MRLNQKSCLFFWIIGLILHASSIWNVIAGQSLLDILIRHQDLTEITSLIRKTPSLNASIHWRHCTIFAPSNAAIRRHRDLGFEIDNNTLIAKRTTEFEDSIPTDSPGYPPIWVTRDLNSTSEIFLNDAGIDKWRRNFGIKNSFGMLQTLHVIDRVLVPAAPESSSDYKLLNPDANKFLEESSHYEIKGVHQITKFAEKVAQHGQSDMFQSEGRHTYFIPVNEAFNEIHSDTLNENVIKRHIVQNHTIFLRSSLIRPAGKEYQTAAITFVVKIGEEDGFFTIRSERKEPDGLLAQNSSNLGQATVLKGNIPVRNGVVHFIDKLLVATDEIVPKTTVAPVSEQCEDTRLTLTEVFAAVREFLDELEAKSKISNKLCEDSTVV